MENLPTKKQVDALTEFFASFDRWERKTVLALAWEAVGAANVQVLGELHFGAQLYAAAVYVEAHEADMTCAQVDWARAILSVAESRAKSSDRVSMVFLHHAVNSVRVADTIIWPLVNSRL